jgi:serine protease Do
MVKKIFPMGYKWMLLLILVGSTLNVAGARSLPDFTQIVEEHRGAVVKISTVTRTKSGGGNTPYNPYGIPLNEIPEIFRHLFGPQDRPQREANSLGSGFIISSDGYVLTNNHVVDGADEVLVRLLDRREFSAKVVGADSRSDIALLKIDAKDLPRVTFAAPDRLKVGEWVLAIGSPFGLDYSVSAGIVSAIGRSIPNQRNENYVPFIQTDVAINPGNSGGPLFNLQGEVVGINSQIYTRSGGSIGLSFSIPVALVLDVTEQLKADGRVSRGRLGVGIQNVDKNLAKSFGLDKPMGALISHVEPDSPAAKADLREGDIILEFDGKAIAESADLPHIVGLTKPGTRVSVAIMRDGKPRNLRVTVGELDAVGSEQLGDKKSDGDANNPLGLTVEPLSDELKSRWNISSGVVITRVASGSPAAMAKLLPGDVLTQVARQSVGSVATFDRIVKALPSGEMVALRIVRQGRAGFVAVEVP